jgi:integrator complex subunit 6
MPVIVFIIDNSASMNQTTYFGTSYLDVAKNAVESFLKIRSRDQISGRNDRYMLLTLDDAPHNIKVGWKEHMNVFTNELKNLKATGLTNIGSILKQAFELLNMNRLSTGMETYGQGRYPFYLEPSMIVLITDGGLLTNTTSVFDELALPPITNLPGNELTIEPFRWDQRFFTIVLNMYSVPFLEQNPNSFIPYASNSPINAMCEVTGGRSYQILSQRMLSQCLESLVSKIQAGVIVNFTRFPSNDTRPPEDATQWEKCRQMIYVPKTSTKGYTIGHWPIPEDYVSTLNATSLTPRSVHPNIKYKCEPMEPMVIEEIPFDKYELEPSPLTQYILEQRQPNTVWQVFISNSMKPNELGHTFGYLKASSNLMNVNLFVLPYNYPLLFQLIYEFFHVLKFKPTKTWFDKFDAYLKSIPPYYYAPLRRVLSKKGLQHLIAENLECCLTVQAQSYLKNVKKQAKILFDQVNAQPSFTNEKFSLLNRYNESLSDSKEFQTWVTSNIDHQRADFIKNQFNEFAGFQLSCKPKKYKNHPSFGDSFLCRDLLIENIAKTRPQLSKYTKSLNIDEFHSVSIQDMGNYHDYLKQQTQPLREVDETTLVRQHMFGNPFKLVSKDQKALFGTDEIDEVLEESTENLQQKNQQVQHYASKRSQSSFGRRKGVKGPLSRRISYSRGNSQSPMYSDESDTESLVSSTSDLQSIDDLTDKKESEPCDSDVIMNPIDDDNNPIEFNIDTNQVSVSTYQFQVDEKRTNPFVDDPDYLKLRRTCVNEVKKPAKNYENLGKILHSNRLNQANRYLVEELVYEAAKFRKFDLIKYLVNLLRNTTVE